MDGKISGIQDTMDLFSDILEEECNKNITEETIISDTLKLLHKIDDSPLLYYCIVKSVFRKKNLLSDSNKKEILHLLNIKPEIQIKEKIVTKTVYKERKPKVYEGDDY
jgi:hypothetical protein